MYEHLQGREPDKPVSALWHMRPRQHGITEVHSAYGDRPWVTRYLAVYSTCFGRVLLDVLLMSRPARHVSRPNLRLGLRLLGAGSVAGLLYVAWRFGFSVAVALEAKRRNLPPLTTAPVVIGEIDEPRSSSASRTPSPARTSSQPLSRSSRTTMTTSTDTRTVHRWIVRVATEVLAPWVWVLVLPLAIGWCPSSPASPPSVSASRFSCLVTLPGR
ncbi:hypothetical protein ACFP3R_17965 [Saccharothrix lopnurensis]|uniref:RDD family protein n=1 Tax=Saccharothrix lopnurensis TaxID=1670621 RepID=A0ABW1P7F4_9PSEU